MIQKDMNRKNSDTTKQRKTHDLLLFQEQCHLFRDRCSDLFDILFKTAEGLLKIKENELYKSHPFCSTWNDFIELQIQPYFQATIILDYMLIVETYLQNRHWMSKSGLKQLGYKKSVFLSWVFNKMQEHKESNLSGSWEIKLRKFYQQSFEELAHIPFSVYQESFWLRFPDLKDNIANNKDDFKIC